jgi:putative transposon-encoded protein
MRKIQINNNELIINEKAELVYELVVTSFGTSAKVGAPKKYIGRRAYVVILKDKK